MRSRPFPGQAASRLRAAGVALTVLALALSACDSRVPAPVVHPAANAAAQAQPLPFTISGSVPQLKDGDTVRLFARGERPDVDGKPQPLATAVVKDGRFSLSGQVKTIIGGRLELGHDFYVPMVLEQASYTVKSTGPDVVAVGGAINDVVFGFATAPEYIAAERVQLATREAAFKGVDMKDAVAVERASDKVEAAGAAMDRIEQAYQARLLDGDAPPLVKLFVLANSKDGKRYPFDKRMAMLAQLQQALGPHPLIASIRTRLEQSRQARAAQEAIVVGGLYKDITATDMDGKQVKLSEVLARNEVVLLDFWASWCTPCRAEFPHLSKLRTAHAGRLEIFSISLDENRDDWLKALKQERAKQDVAWLNLIDSGGLQATPANTYGVLGLPDNYLLSHEGKVVGKQLFGSELDAAVAKLLATGAAKRG